MTRAKFTLGFLLMLSASTVGLAQSPEAVQGTWSGTFRSKHLHIAPFMLTLIVNPDMHAHLVNKSGLTNYCLLRNVDFHVIVNGSNVVLAGTDEVKNTVTFEGTIDNTSRVLTLNYVTNGSASGKCESDDGTAYLEKR